MDETIDVKGRYVVNVIIGNLELENAGKIFLLHTEVLEKANNSTITKMFDKSMLLFIISYLIIFLSDAAPYMVKAGKVIQNLYSKMIRLTYMSHAIHRVPKKLGQIFKI